MVLPVEPAPRLADSLRREVRPAFPILAGISFAHLINDTLQSLLPAVYPYLKSAFALSFAQVGMMTLALMLTASLLQPLVGMIADRRPMPYALVAGMSCSLAGLLLLSSAASYGLLLVAAGLLGLGSAVFHPESSRVARMASGGQHGLAQSLFQVGGNTGSALGPLIGAFLVIPYGQRSLAWCALLAMSAIAVLWKVGEWSNSRHPTRDVHTTAGSVSAAERRVPHGRVRWALIILVVLLFSKFFYTASLSNYYTFYLITTFGVDVRTAQFCLFAFLAAVAVGTIGGGIVGDRIGRKPVIWISILGVLPFTLLLPYANFVWTQVLAITIGLIMASAFSAIVVYAQELVPGRVGLISGIYFGFAFGLGGVGAAALGRLADAIGIVSVYRICAFLPLIGLLAAWLPDVDAVERRSIRTFEEAQS
jgi:FSR family fosmidomycin resistance protein-like MFS transporter